MKPSKNISAISILGVTMLMSAAAFAGMEIEVDAAVEFPVYVTDPGMTEPDMDTENMAVSSVSTKSTISTPRQAANQPPSNTAKAEQIAAPDRVEAALVENTGVGNQKSIDLESNVKSAGKKEVVTVGVGDVNKFITKYENIQIRSFLKEGEELFIEGGVFYVIPSDERPITMQINPAHDARAGITLFLLPKAIPAVTKVIEFPSHSFNGDKEYADRFEQGHSHTTLIADLLAAVAEETVPAGYSLRSPNVSDFEKETACYGDEKQRLETKLFSIAEGGAYKVEIYAWRNTRNEEQTLKHIYCWRPDSGVLGLTSYPSDRLKPGEDGEIYIVKSVQMPSLELKRSRAKFPQEEVMSDGK